MAEWREPIKVIADILSHELNIGSDRIFIYNDGRPLPKDSNAYIVLSINGTEVFRNTSEFTQSDNKEHLNQNVRQNIIASVISRDTSARTLAQRVVMSLGSIYSQQTQEKYACHVARIANITDASFLEETDMLTRMDVSIKILSWMKYDKEVDYYEVEDYSTMFEG